RLRSNLFHGTIPATFSALTKLSVIDLSWNQLTGTIPPFSTSIQKILLDYNTLSGPIPSHLALPDLSLLRLSNNLLTGGIPNTFTRLSFMYFLEIAGNNLTSGLDVVAQMTWLGGILLNNNGFTGVIPASFTAMWPRKP
ncbi:unnamed protein product, partial [Closterium sp. Yama58-4]